MELPEEPRSIPEWFYGVLGKPSATPTHTPTPQSIVYTFQYGLQEYIYDPLIELIDYATTQQNPTNDIVAQSIRFGLLRFRELIIHKASDSYCANDANRGPKGYHRRDTLYQQMVSAMNAEDRYNRKSMLLSKMGNPRHYSSVMYNIETLILREVQLLKNLMSMLTAEAMSAFNCIAVEAAEFVFISKADFQSMTRAISRYIANYYGNLSKVAIPLEYLLIYDEYSIKRYIADVDKLNRTQQDTSFLTNGMLNVSLMIRDMIDPSLKGI